MPRGYTSITFKGGDRDGEVISDVSLRNLPDTLNFRNDVYFSTALDGGVSVMKGPLNNNWHSYSIDIYTKVENEKHKSGTVFEFLETRMVERCSAITKKNKQCLKSAIYGKTYCSETHKPKVLSNSQGN